MNAYGVGLGTSHRSNESEARTDRTRSQRTAAPALRMRFERFELDEAEAQLTCAGQPVPLAPKPFAVLCALAARRTRW